MKPIGGFFELEIPHRGNDPHPQAIGLSTGRACLMVMLARLKPSLVYVPYYTCDATLEPFRRLGVTTRFYALGEDLAPASVALGSGEYILWTDYFGVCGPITERLKRHYGAQLLIDDTHAFYRQGHVGHWSFNSARKFFGVPDGAFLYAPVALDVTADRFAQASLLHGTLRLLGRQAEGFAAYQAYEKSLNCEVRRISLVSERLLRVVDYEAALRARVRNFEFLSERLGSRNTLALEPAPQAVPFCYPYLPVRPVDRPALYAKELFVPTLWPEVLRREAEGFGFEKRLSTELLPLPVDHRYTPEDLQVLADYLVGVS
ncbi:MAG: hypothetical protein AABY95_10130 [Pseudomonadota bacterium]